MRCRLFARLLCCVILFTGLPLFAAWWQPDALFSLLAYLRPGVVWRVETTERVVALSLDDAPSSLTPDILNLLDKYDARATFFVLGRHLERHSADLTKWPSPKDRLSSLELQICPVNTSLPDPGPRALIARLRALGHEPAHHTWSDRMTLSIPRSELDLEFDRLDAILYSCPVEYPKWFRPGHGVYDSELVKFVESHGYKTVLGNVHPFDPQIQSKRLFCLANAKSIDVL